MRLWLLLPFCVGCAGQVAAIGDVRDDADAAELRVDSAIDTGAAVADANDATIITWPILAAGTVYCGTAGACELATKTCCQTAEGAEKGTFSCVPGASCPGRYDAIIRCEKKSDCPGAELCCAGIGLNGNLHAGCAASCGTSFQRCASTGECADCRNRNCREYPLHACGATTPWCD